jgi:glyoxylase-like metal-dependent hydrolase (beta-lactamase superfamily II)
MDAMHCTRKITEELVWVGGNDRRLAMFEGVYSVPRGVSYNSYLLLDEKTVLFDTVDRSVVRVFLENVAEGLGGRGLDYLVVQHMEPDHTAALMEVMSRHPRAELVCTAKTAAMIGQFFGEDVSGRAMTVKEGQAGNRRAQPGFPHGAVGVTGRRGYGYLRRKRKILVLGRRFRRLRGNKRSIFDDEVDFERDYWTSPRYYTNIVLSTAPLFSR